VYDKKNDVKLCIILTSLFPFLLLLLLLLLLLPSPPPPPLL